MDLDAIEHRNAKYAQHPGSLRCCNAHDTADDVPALVARVRELEDENKKLRDTAAVAHYVADHWREFTAGAGWTIASHPLCLVLAALNGETEPEQLGLEEEDRAALDWARDIAKEA